MDPDIITLSADKGNVTVIRQTEEYKKEIRQLLDPTTHRKLKQDPTNKITKQTNMLVRSFSLHPNVIPWSFKMETLPPRLYGLQKIHKDSTPLKSIVSTFGSPTYELAKHLATLL
ncbi:hypothetical protein JRQ81_001817 [Phrynocephalus forsythii]|uniref:Uncharacterized protein n=1 Tax=Phrynocephalus forsythii TaxID=171643 RepID=A0A9Q0Y9K0_9SAUR|nr:hypothetical protein JRQ81_001817 [Phrynocephalus forsythii]